MQETLGQAHGHWVKDGTKFGAGGVYRWGLAVARFRVPRNAAPAWGKLILSSEKASPILARRPENALRVTSYSCLAQRLS